MSPILHAFIYLGLVLHAKAQYQPGPDERAIKAATQELSFRCKQIAEADAEQSEALKRPLSRDAEIALGSESNLLTFLSDPATSYLDRIAVVSAKLYPPDPEPQFIGSLLDDALTRRQNATRAAALITPEELPALWKAAAALQEVQVVMPSPCDYVMSANLTPARLDRT